MFYFINRELSIDQSYISTGERNLILTSLLSPLLIGTGGESIVWATLFRRALLTQTEEWGGGEIIWDAVICAMLIARETGVRYHVESYQRPKKWYLMPPCLTFSIIRYGSRVKWSNARKEVAPFPTAWCSSYWKGILWVDLDNSHQLFIYMNICICIYTLICMYIYMCVYVYTYMCVHIYIYMCVCVCMRICGYVYIYVCMYEYIYKYVYIFVDVYIYIYIYIWIHVCVYICLCICLYLYSYIYIYLF